MKVPTNDPSRPDVDTPSAAPRPALAAGSLRTWGAVAISVSVLAPGMAMALNGGGVAAAAGGSTPLVMLLGGVACLTVAVVVVGFTRRMAAAGYAYTYLSRALGQRAGFLAGWLYFFAMAVFVAPAMAAVSWLATDLLGVDRSWWLPFFLVGMVLIVVMSVVRVSLTTKVQLAVGGVTVLALLIMDVLVVAKGGANGQSAGAFTFGHTVQGGFHGVFYGLILGVTSYIGFESAADFGEETRNARRSVPIAVAAVMAFAIVFYVLTTYAVTIGYGVEDLQADPSPWVSGNIFPVARRFGGDLLATVAETGALLSGFICCLAAANSGARMLFAMGRERVMPARLARTHPRYRTPVNATLALVGVATVLALVVGYGFASDALGGAALTVLYFWLTVGTLAVILVYIALCVGGIVYFRRVSTRFRPVLHGVVPAVGALIFAATWVGSVYPPPDGVLAAAPYVVVAWLVVGVGVLVTLVRRRPEAVGRIGSILGEDTEPVTR